MFLLSAVMLLALSGVALADDTKVTVSVSNGDAVLVQKPVTVTDVDEDGALTIADALYCAHEAYFEGGAAAGFACSIGGYGLQLDKLWGVANGGSFGYYVNNVSAMGLGDAVKDGDSVYAFVYTDLVGWSDSYSFFDKDTASVTEGDKVKLTLSGMGFDENWAPVTAPVAGAKILIDGKETGVTTGEDGSFEVAVESAGEYVISAKSDEKILVPPLCVVTAAAKATPTPVPTDTPTPTPTVTDAPTEEGTGTTDKAPMWPVIVWASLFAIVAIVLIAVVAKNKK